ncbi:hypothetical protein OE88DRAFT_1637413 [Heliocybe sulcata]|uniref:F-box domain-containing protein n=1 Tax=Heliocybe sulcata TaxID=5364 RepID=A0A5C3MTC1_9AGAM|nr:hypothetical protein OE88DRAFT_1637413 [Heliocybe sulcata]
MHTDDSVVRRKQAVPTAHALPVELYHEIFGHVKSRRDLCSLIRISRFHQPLVARFLYHTVELSKYSEHTEQFCKAILRTPYYGGLVVSLTIHGDNHYPVSLPDLECFRLWCNVACALRRLTRLETLHLVRLPQVYTWILKKCSFSLKELHCGHNKFDSDLLSFLNTQQRLSSIHWVVPDICPSRGRPPPSFPKTLLAKKALPALEKLVTNCPSLAVALVPGRPVHRLRILSETVDETLTSTIASSTAPLLCLETHTPLSGTLLSDDTLRSLATLKDLRTLVLRDRVSRGILLSLKDHCPSLEAVCCLFEGRLNDSGDYLRFPMAPVGKPQRLRDSEVPLWKDA